MNSIPHDLLERLKQSGQEHVLSWWDELNEEQRQRLVEQLRTIDLPELARLYSQREQKFILPSRERITPLPWPDEHKLEENRRLGEQAFRAGQVAFLVVAGGQGSRLGFEHPKGMFPIGPVTNKTLFQVHAEKILALQRRHGARFPLLVMTSPATDAETRKFFQERNFFGLPQDEVFFFCQGTMPALDLATGKLLLDAKDRLFLSPNGHGGTLTGLADSGLLDRLQKKGIRTIYYFQVDNPLVNLADMEFIGQHLAPQSTLSPGGRGQGEGGAQVSSKVLTKDFPMDKLGNYVLVDGRSFMIEYSDLPEEMANERDEQGRLRLWAGSPAIHLFDVAFLREVTQGSLRIPFHVARKKVAYLDQTGNLVTPAKENALKFEMFIFDVLPLAERWSVVITTRRKEFEPLKNATGPDSPQTVKRAISTLAADWLQEAGVAVPRDDHGYAAVPVEISPLFALDAQELARKVDRGLRIDKATYLE